MRDVGEWDTVAVGRRRQLGRVVRLVAVVVVGFVGAAAGLLGPYLDLSEGPYVDGFTEFEQAGWDGSDCYFSPAAAELDDRVGQLLVLLPVGMAVLVAAGFGLAVARRSMARTAVQGEIDSATEDVLLVSVVLAVVSGITFATTYGFAIGRLLDPGCVRAAVPGLPVTGLVLLAAAVTAIAAGDWLEKRSARRRLLRATRQSHEASRSGA